jgi:GNAT superfamily N-acetyltransferase
MVTFRESAVTDAAAHELLTEYFEARANGFPAGPYAYLRSFPRAEHFVPPAGVFLVVQHGGEDVGCGGIRAVEAGAPGQVRYEVKHLWIQPRARGLGLGRALLHELERRAADFGTTELVLDTNANLEVARALYLTSGFESIEPYNDNPNATDWYGKKLP